MPHSLHIKAIVRPALQRLAAALVVAAQPALADLRSSTLSDLIDSSTVIMLARVETHDGAQARPGRAQVKPQQSFKGPPTADPLTLSWSDEVHDQRLPEPPSQVLLFLAPRQGVLTGTHYGRSYWPVETAPLTGTRCSRYTRYRYPIDMLRLSAAQSRQWLQTLPRQANLPVQRILCLDDLDHLLNPTNPRSPR